MGADELRFLPDEASAFLERATGQRLSPEEVAALGARTEGWIAALQLAALQINALGSQDRAARDAFIDAFAGDDRYIMDYLMQEVLDHQPPAIQAFVLQTAILERMCGPLCEALTGGGRGQATLEALERQNLFILPLDSRRQWYRYHRLFLFAELLRHRLRQQIGPEGVGALYGRAARWFEAQGLTDEAIDYALRAHDFARATRLIVQRAEAMLGRNEVTTLQSWLHAYPREILAHGPYLCVLQA